MSPERWSAFVAVLLVVLCAPGPDFAVVLRHALTSARAGTRAAAGVATGQLGHTAAAALGLSAVVAARPDVLALLRAAGTAYLAWLGLRTLLGALRRAPDAAPGGVVARAGRPFRDGLAGNLLNPKALLLFLGLLPQFVAPPGVTAQVLLLAATTVVASVLWWALVIAAAARGRAVLGGRARRAVDAGTGAVLVGVAVGVALA